MINHLHSHRTTPIPSRRSIAGLGLATAVVVGATFHVVTGPVFDGRHLVGFLIGLVGSVALVLQVFNRAAQRGELVYQQRARATALEKAEQERAANTGTWQDPATQQPVLQVRFEQGLFWAFGAFTSEWAGPRDDCGWYRLASASYAFIAIAEAERAGYLPSAQEGTRAIKARLNLPAKDKADA